MKTKKHVKIMLLCMILTLGIVSPAFSQTQLGDLTATMDAFADSMAKALPFNASMGLNWSDAYIGKFFPSLPPHFGVGVSGGFTIMDADYIGDLLNIFSPGLSGDLLSLSGFPILGMMAEARLGGIILPFDIGVKIGILPFSPGLFDLDYFLVGADFRYAVVKGNLILPKISVGVGFNHLSGGIGRNIGKGLSIAYVDPAETPSAKTLSLSQPKIGIDWSTNTVDFKAQISKRLNIPIIRLGFTPYIGAGASRGTSEVSYGLKTTVTTDGNIDQAREIFKAAGIDIPATLDGFSSTKEITGWNMRAFGGLSFNIVLLSFDLTGLYSFNDANFGVTFGARLQI